MASRWHWWAPRGTCPKRGHKHCKIATDDAGRTIDDMAVAYEGCLTTCSATLVATVPNFAKPDGHPAMKPRDFSHKNGKIYFRTSTHGSFIWIFIVVP